MLKVSHMAGMSLSRLLFPALFCTDSFLFRSLLPFLAVLLRLLSAAFSLLLPALYILVYIMSMLFLVCVGCCGFLDRTERLVYYGCVDARGCGALGFPVCRMVGVVSSLASFTA